MQWLAVHRDKRKEESSIMMAGNDQKETKRKKTVVKREAEERYIKGRQKNTSERRSFTVRKAR